MTDTASVPRRLPAPRQRGRRSLESVIAARRSVREFYDRPLDERQLSQLLWSAQGITDRRHDLRAAPSAGGLYPIELYVCTAQGVDHYSPSGHRLRRLTARDRRKAVHRAALRQESVRRAAALFVFAAVWRRTTDRYGAVDGLRYVHMDAAHAAAHVLLQAVALGLGAVPIGAFHNEKVREILELPADHDPVYLVAVGHPVKAGN